MPHDDKTAIQTVNDTLRDLPLLDRVAALCASLVHEEPRAPEALCVLVEVALMLAKHLPPSQQVAVQWHLQNAIEDLRAQWN